MLIYLCSEKLPWQGLKFKDINARKKYLEMLYLKKFTPPEILCKGLPIEFVEYIKYCKNLAFEQTPDYEYLRNRFRTILLSITLKVFKLSLITLTHLIFKSLKYTSFAPLLIASIP